MSKKYKQLLSLFVTLFFLSSIIFFIWTKTLGSSEYKQKKHDNFYLSADIDNNFSINDLSNDNNLVQAKNILLFINNNVDERGFYTSGLSCDLGNIDECEMALLDDTRREAPYKKIAAHRDSIPVMWARLKYFERTGDEKQKQLLYQDIDNMINHIIDNEVFILQTMNLGCSVMNEIYASPKIDLEYKLKAKKICLNSSFEYADKGLISQSKLTNWSYDGGGIEIKPSKIKKEFRVDDLIIEINNLIVKIFIDNEIFEEGFELKDAADERDIHKELFAGINKYAEYKIDNDSTDAYLFFLLSLRQSLQWYYDNRQAFFMDNLCLLSANINQYLDQHFEYFSNEQIREIEEHVAAQLNFDISIFDSPLCHYLSYHIGESKQYELKKKFDPGPAMHINKNGRYWLEYNQYFYSTIDNALIAGLLSVIDWK